MTGTTSLANPKTAYDETERNFIFQEFKGLSNARQENYSDNTLREWVKSFWEKKFSANQVCKMIRAVKLNTKIFGKVTMHDFLEADISQAEEIIVRTSCNMEYFFAILECKSCHKCTSIWKKELYQFKMVRICEHTLLDEFGLKALYPKLTENNQIFEI